jgi:hypothetical protein
VKLEQALAAARAELERLRAAGGYAGDLGAEQLHLPDRRSDERLLEWAVIEPDIELVRSTRSWGGPITAVKRGLVHVMRQYLAQLASQQTRFNVHMLVRLAELEDRIADLEQWAGAHDESLHADGIGAPRDRERSQRLAAQLDVDSPGPT